MLQISFDKAAFRQSWLGRPLGRLGRASVLAASMLAIASVAFAAWLLYAGVLNAAVTSRTFGPFNFSLALVDAGTCTVALTDPNTVDVTWGGVGPGDVCDLNIRFNNLGSSVAFTRWVPLVADPAITATSSTCGASASGGVDIATDLQLTLDPNLSSPSATYNVSYQAEAAMSAPTCPSP